MQGRRARAPRAAAAGARAAGSDTMGLTLRPRLAPGRVCGTDGGAGRAPGPGGRVAGAGGGEPAGLARRGA
jgi:hypothetical protein